jgi:Tol biopolymer transport system component
VSWVGFRLTVVVVTVAAVAAGRLPGDSHALRRAGAGQTSRGEGDVALPAGEILVTRAKRAGNRYRTDLYAVRSDGSRLRLVARDAADAAASRDGRTIAFVRAGAIWVMRRGASGLRQVTRPSFPKYADRDPSWSPDAKTLYFSRATDVGNGKTASIYAIRSDGRGLRRVTHASQDSGWHDEAACHEAPSVSPNGKTVVYQLIGSCAHGDGYAIAASSSRGKPQKLGFRLAEPADAFDPTYERASWSPTRMEIAYGVYDPVECRTTQRLWLYTSSNDAAPHEVLSVETSVRAWQGCLPLRPAWSSDGSWIAFLKPTTWITLRPVVRLRPFEDYPRGDVWLVRADGTGLRRLTTTGDFIANAWLPS